MLHEVGAPQGRPWDHSPAAGSLAGTILVAVASSLVTLTVVLLLLPGMGRPLPPLLGPAAGSPSLPASLADDAAMSIAEIYARSAPAVVHIEATRGMRGLGTGSGFIVSPSGRIVTNHHVVDGARSLRVRLGDARELPAEVIGRDPATDLALLQVDAGAPLPTLPLAEGEGLAVGDLALTIGSPFGFEQSLSTGHVSALGRTLRGNDDWGTVIDGAIQTDAAVNPGNSGGPLLNGRGEVIGVTTAIFSTGHGFEGVGFAVPVALLRAVLPELAARGYVLRPFLGASGINVTEHLATMLSLPAQSGVLVQTVAAESPAAKAGLVAGSRAIPFAAGQQLSLGGDLIVAIDGLPLGSVADLSREVGRHAVGDALRLTVLRGDERLELRGILGVQPPPE